MGIADLQLHLFIRDEPAASGRAIVRDATSDAYFRALLAHEGISESLVERPAAKLRAILSTLEGKGPLIFIAPRNLPDYDVMYQLVRTISLPRPVISANCDTPQQRQLSEQQISAYVLYRLEPPKSALGVQSFAPELSIVPATEASSWTTFCSR